MVPLAGAVLPHRHGEGRAVLPESKNRANRQWGFPGNLGDPVVSMRTSASGVAEPEELLVHRRCVLAGGSEAQNASGGTAKRRQRSAAGGTAGSRSALIVPSKRGHGTRPDRVEGSEASDRGIVAGKDGECIEIRVPCQRNNND